MIEAHLFAIEMPYSNTDQCSLLDSSRDHACPKQYFHRRGAKDAEKEFFVWRTKGPVKFTGEIPPNKKASVPFRQGP